jgi:predicted RNase H-like HicB family nuclease
MALRTYNFKVIIEPDEDFDGNPSGFHAYCPAIESQGASTWGETREMALKNINEVVHLIIDGFIEEGKPLPDGSDGYLQVEEVSLDRPCITVTV